MITRLFNRTALHEHVEPAQRVLGVAELAPDSEQLKGLLAADPAPEVRAAAARRCADAAALAAALATEVDGTVRAALAAALADALCALPDAATAGALLAGDRCTDAIRARGRPARAGRRAPPRGDRGDRATKPRWSSSRRTRAHAETRLAAAERVHLPESLRRLADAARNKDHGVARIARQRLDAIEDRAQQEAKADADPGASSRRSSCGPARSSPR